MTQKEREDEIIKKAYEYMDTVPLDTQLTAFGDFINGAKWADANPYKISLSAAERGIIDEIKLVLKNASQVYMNDYSKELEFLNKIRKL